MCVCVLDKQSRRVLTYCIFLFFVFCTKNVPVLRRFLFCFFDRVSAGEAEAAAERRLTELEARLADAVSERDQLGQEAEALRQQVASGAEEDEEKVSKELVAMKVKLSYF